MAAILSQPPARQATVATKVSIQSKVSFATLVAIGAVCIAVLLATLAVQFTLAINQMATAIVSIATTTVCTDPANIVCGASVTPVWPHSNTTYQTSAISRGYGPGNLTDGQLSTFAYAADVRYGFEITLATVRDIGRIEVTWGKWGEQAGYMADYHVYVTADNISWDEVAGAAQSPGTATTIIALSTPRKVIRIRVTSGYGLNSNGSWTVGGFPVTNQWIGINELKAFAPISASAIPAGNFETTNVNFVLSGVVDSISSVTTFPFEGARAGKVTLKRVGVLGGAMSLQLPVGTQAGNLKPGTSYRLAARLRSDRSSELQFLGLRVASKGQGRLGNNVGGKTDAEWRRSVVYVTTPTAAEIASNPAWANIEVAVYVQKITSQSLTSGTSIQFYVDGMTATEGTPKPEIDLSLSPLPLPATSVRPSGRNVVLARVILDTAGSTEGLRVDWFKVGVVTAAPNKPTDAFFFHADDSQNKKLVFGSDPTVTTPGGQDAVRFDLNEAILYIPPNDSRVLTVKATIDPAAPVGGRYRIILPAGTAVSTAGASGATGGSGSGGAGGAGATGTNGVAIDNNGDDGDGGESGGGGGSGGGGAQPNQCMANRPTSTFIEAAVNSVEDPPCDPLRLPSPWPSDNGKGKWYVTRTFLVATTFVTDAAGNQKEKNTCTGGWYSTPGPSTNSPIDCRYKDLEVVEQTWTEGYGGYTRTNEITKPIGGPTCDHCCFTEQDSRVLKAESFNADTHFCCNPAVDSDVKESYVVPRCSPKETNCQANASASWGGRVTVGSPLSDGCCPYNSNRDSDSVTRFLDNLAADSDCRATVSAAQSACHSNQDSDHNQGCAVDLVSVSGCGAVTGSGASSTWCKWESDDNGGGHYHCNACLWDTY